MQSIPLKTAGSNVEAFSVNGVRVLLRHNQAHEAVAVRLVLLGGSLQLSAQTAGADLMYARTARRGTQDFPKDKLNNELDRMGIDLGASIGEDWTTFHLRCLHRDFAAAWRLFVDVTLHPLLEPSELTVVREQVLLGILQRKDSSDGCLADLAREQLYRDHAYAVDPSGTEESIGELTDSAIRSHLQANLQRSRLLLVVVGNLQREDIEQRCQEAFAELPQGTDWTAYAGPLSFTKPALHIEKRELPTNYVMGQFAAPSLTDKAHPATHMALSILRDRFFEEVRTKRNLSYAPAAGLGNLAANSGWIYVTAVDPRTTIEVMRNEMHKLGHEELAAQDLADKVQVYLTRYYLQNETNHAQAGFLGRYELLGGGWENSLGFVERLEALKPIDVQNAAREVLTNIQYTFLGNPDLFGPEDIVNP